ncbi:MAG: tRNA (adenosine(37)-N6)-threonylcarbamoyltransferase complex dimerization subunit type 1 TsaB [Proteocatella sp.]
MKILAIDTSSSALGIAVTDEETMLAEFTQNKALTHSEKLMPLIDTMLTNIDEKIYNMDAIACSIGPGSFTGIRIGVATANAFAMARNIPVIGISSLEALAYNFKYTDYVVVSTMYAQREDYYRGIYSFEKQKLSVVKAEEAISFEEIAEEIKALSLTGKKVVVLGELNSRLKGILDENSAKSVLINNCILADKTLNQINASNLCEIAREIIKNKNNSELPRYIEPVYIRKPQAEVQYEEKLRALEKSGE